MEKSRKKAKSSSESPAPCPQRYSIRKDEDGQYLTCVEAPNIAVRIERGFVASQAAVKRAKKGTIFLDGAASGEPSMDVQKRIYNLDHHEGCVRPFTLATCEQAMVLVIKGLDLRSGEWTVYGNEPDLDTVLAIWILLNHMQLSGPESKVRTKVMPLVRLEGAIDANGLKFTELCAFPKSLEKKTLALIEELRVPELEIKGEGKWSTVNFLEYTVQVLNLIDEKFYSPGYFAETPSIDEFLRVSISERRVAVFCRSQTGIYEVEKALSHLHGNNIGLIILQKNPRTYTVRQVDPFLPIPLDAFYDRLNLIDPAVERGGESNRWGGSAEIGGSPRATGTSLSANEIARICKWVYSPPNRLRRFGASLLSVGASLLVVLVALILAFINANPIPEIRLGTFAAQSSQPFFVFLTVALAPALLTILGIKHRRQFGLRLPTGWKWLLFLPAILVAGTLGGPWVLPTFVPSPVGSLVFALVMPFVAEVLHRGVVHGILVGSFKVQRPKGRWYVSLPNIIAGITSATMSSLLFLPHILSNPEGPGMWAAFTWILGALVLGLSCGMARERSGSLIPPFLIHLISALWVNFELGLL